MAGTQFALGSPRADQPYPIETELVKMMAQSPAGARIGSMYLGNYWQERGQAQNAYDQQVQAQNAFAYQQAQNALVQERQKNMIDLIGKPGGAEIIAGTPSLSYGLASDLSAPAIGDVANVQRNLDVGKTIEAVGRGAYPLVQAGLPPNAADIGSVIPQAGVTQGTPLQLQVEGMKEAGKNARAAAAAAQEPPVTIHTELPAGPGGQTRGLSVQAKTKTGGIPAAVAQLDRARADLGIPPAPAGPGMGTPPPGDSSSTSATTSAAPSTSAGSVQDYRTPAGMNAQSQARDRLQGLLKSSNPSDRAAAADVIQKMNNERTGGAIPLNSQGQLVGATNKTY